MVYQVNKLNKIIIVLFLVLTAFVCVAGASTVFDCSVINANVYGATGSVDISPNPVSSIAVDIIHDKNEYIHISGLTSSTSLAFKHQNITLIPIGVRGGAAYLKNSIAMNGYEFNYDSGGYPVDETNPFVVYYDVGGSKTIVLNLSTIGKSDIITQTVITNLEIIKDKEEGGTVLTTTYYLKISVAKDGSLMPDVDVRVFSASGIDIYTTDSYGSVTIEVIPTKTYVISLLDGEDSITYIADNYALQYVTLRYPSSINRDNLTYSATLRDNRYIDVKFVNSIAENTYNLRLLITDSNKNVVLERNVANTSNYSYTFDTNEVNIKNFIVSITADPNGDYVNHIYKAYVLDVKTYVERGQKSDRLIVGNIPLIPDEMDDNWRAFIFGGLIMIISALFSYNHSTKGCVIVAIIAAVMTYLEFLPLNLPWVCCMVVLAFLTVYAHSAQNEG